MAERVLALGPSDLTKMERAVTAQAAAGTWARAEAAMDEAPRRESEAHRRAVEANGGFDPRTGKRVAGTEPDAGKWAAFVGGVKVKLDDGTCLSVHRGQRRPFIIDPDVTDQTSLPPGVPRPPGLADDASAAHLGQLERRDAANPAGDPGSRLGGHAAAEPGSRHGPGPGRERHVGPAAP